MTPESGLLSKPAEPSKVSIEDIVAKVKTYNPQASVDVLRRVPGLGQGHEGQTRKSGEPYVFHRSPSPRSSPR
jgi:(p)ppGpp synthase/HD superfamily hydrolase